MGRRSDHSKEELKSLIIDTAEALLVKKGMKALGARLIAREIGYSAGTLYNVFSDMDEIILFLNARTLDEMRSVLEKGLRKVKTKEDVGRHMAWVYLQYNRENVERCKLLLEYSYPKGKSLPLWYQAKVDALFFLLEQALSVVFGERKALKALSHLLWASLHGICHLELNGKLSTVQSESAEALCLSLFQYTLSGYERKE